jgi:ABC-type glycerol-3-phosphate transport system substrate-binding protein
MNPRTVARLTLLLAILWSAPAHAGADPLASHRGKRVVVATYFAEFLPGLRAVAPLFRKETGLELSVQGVPYAQYRFWVQTRFLAQDAPEVLLLEGTSDPWQYGQAGQVMELSDAFNRPNPMAGSEAPWSESFSTELLQFSYDPSGRLFLVPYAQYGVGFFYNADLYEEFGGSPPSTWTEFRTLLAGAAASPALQQRRIAPMTVAVRPDDAQTLWMAAIILECFLRAHTPAVNLRTQSVDWQFDAAEPDSVAGEKIDLSERMAAFSRGIIDPARSPEFREAARMVRQLVPWWRPDFLSLSGEELYRLFASGRSLNFMNGTWYLKDIHPLQEQMRRVAPSAAFEFGTFPFPELDGEWARLARAGGVNQNTGLRGCLLLPRQQREPWREEAAIRLAQFLTAPHITQIVFDESNVYDLPAMPEVRAKPESQPLVPRTRYAFLPLAYFEGYDAQAVSEFWPAWQAYLGSPETEAELDRFLERLSASHRGALRRAAAAFPEDVDPEFLTAALGADWEAEW